VRIEQDAHTLQEHVEDVVDVALVAGEERREVRQQLAVVAHEVPLLKRLAVADDLVHTCQQHVYELAVYNVEHSIITLLALLRPLVENTDCGVNFVLVPHWRAQDRVGGPACQLICHRVVAWVLHRRVGHIRQDFRSNDVTWSDVSILHFAYSSLSQASALPFAKTWHSNALTCNSAFVLAKWNALPLAVAA
jgi:hypothetical protein